MDDSLSDDKLCGFLFAVLAVTPSQPDPCPSLGFKERCNLFGDSSNAVGFRSENGVVLVPVDSAAKQNEGGSASASDSAQCQVVGRESRIDYDGNALVSTTQKKGNVKRKIRVVSGSGSLRKKRMTQIGMVNGTVSVIHQLHALVRKKCLKIDARVILVDLGDCGEARAVVLVDVYLPIALWSGWQFPKSGSTAGALFRHLRCDWDERRSVLSCLNYIRKIQGACESIWNLCDCHVFGCKLHYQARDSSKNSLFELHEIFKSVPGVGKERKPDNSGIVPLNDSQRCGIWELSDDILTKILAPLSPMDIARVSATCRHMRFLAASIMPCTKLKLFPHQQTAVEWMLHRERNAERLAHPLYVSFSTEDGFVFHMNIVSGEIVIGEAPTIKDFCGGMFCDEPGLGKTVTTLSLILKTQGTLADPPDGSNVVWCSHNGNLKCGYYDIVGSYIIDSSNLGKRGICQDAWNNENHDHSSKRARLKIPAEKTSGLNKKCSGEEKKSPIGEYSEQPMAASRSSWGLSSIKKNLCATFEEGAGHSKERKDSVNSLKLEHASSAETRISEKMPVNTSFGHEKGCERPEKPTLDSVECNDTWIQCDACQKWRKLADSSMANTNAAWFCSMNTDPLYQSCSIPEQPWHNSCEITYLPGFHVKGSAGGEKKNVSFFTGVLKEHYPMINSETKKALTWLARLPPDKLSEMEINGIRGPVLSTFVVSTRYVNPYHKIFQAFGLIKKLEKGVNKWYYPPNLNNNLAFDVTALGMALCEPLDSFRLYLSRATLIVVPANLVDHWKTQIEKHVKHSQLRVYVWNDTWKCKPSVHSLAWDYDVIITTFSRLSAEWSTCKRSVLMHVHWLRIILDEGHTLGSSLNLTNKLQMAISLTASNRWMLTGTPTPNTPKSQLSHLQPLLRFLHEEAYGLNPKSWEVGILKPFEAEMEEGRFRLLQLLRNCMISARKTDLHNIPPCIKKAVFVDFTEDHARSYNELVLTVRRNLLMADWNDSSHIESLLNSKQWKFRAETIKNVRLSCCVAGHIKVTHTGEDIQETMDMLVEGGMDPDSAEYSSIKYNLLCGGWCVRCKEWCRLPFITPCWHLLCLDCVALDSTKCTYPGCNKLYEMQNPDSLARPENPNPKWPVPKDLIELQPSYKQDAWDPDWQSTSSSKVSYLVQRLNTLQESNKKGYYSSNDQVLAESSCPLVMGDVKSSFQQCPPSTEPNNMPEKVIIFSQFLEHIHVIEQQLTIAGIKYAGMYSPMPLTNKKKSLATFQHDPGCMALVMDGSAALGLDLSFVTHLFLMEPIWDKSMEEQVISRAHRMGACRPIHVETLAMRGTIEEQMLEFLQDADRRRNSPSAVVQSNDGRKFPTKGVIQFEEGVRGRSLHDFAENSYLLNLRFANSNPNAVEGV
ncbi:hypothetical protein QN277_002077 [Acacia crassicarpa]|uniref:F-box protein n=1 Tax=Acacia crassicarpa TaxID=499986 RepID=A0AAE1NA04_9FABA|nr:hypothetical protein QN277_002077 [Acacia crassicarpa]